MKRVTLRLISSGTKVDAASLRTELDRLLLRSRRPITFRLGEAAEVEGGILLAEIATDASKEELLSLLSPLENVIPVKIQDIGWGWPLTAAREKLGRRQESPRMLLVDPYGAVGPQDVPEKTYVRGKRQIVRGVASAVFSVGIILSLLWTYFRASVAREWMLEHETSVMLLWTAIWFVWVIFRVPLIPFHRSGYVTRITCDPQGIAVKDWFGHKARRLTWKEIWGLDMRFEECVVRSNKLNLTLPTSDVFGPQDRPMLIKTILDRSELLLVGGGKSAPLLYRRFDAPF